LMNRQRTFLKHFMKWSLVKNVDLALEPLFNWLARKKHFHCWIRPPAPDSDMDGHSCSPEAPEYWGSVLRQYSTMPITHYGASNSTHLTLQPTDIMKLIGHSDHDGSPVQAGPAAPSISKKSVYLTGFFCLTHTFYSTSPSSSLDITIVLA